MTSLTPLTSKCYTLQGHCYPKVDESTIHAFWLGMGLYLVTCYAVLLKGVGFNCFSFSSCNVLLGTHTAEGNVACFHYCGKL